MVGVDIVRSEESVKDHCHYKAVSTYYRAGTLHIIYTHTSIYIHAYTQVRIQQLEKSSMHDMLR